MRLRTAAACACILVGCYEGVSPRDGQASASATGGTSEPESSGGATDATDETPEVAEASPGVRLLTRREVRNAIWDLLGVSIDLSAIPAERYVEGHGHIAFAQGAGLDDVETYYEVALLTAAEAVPRLAPGCDVAMNPCARQWAATFLSRAFRRPVPTDVEAHYLALLDDAEAGDDVGERLEIVVAAVLSSPHFLYRRELGGDPVDGEPHTWWLDEYEIASRLSFLVWQSVPDDALLQAAARSELHNPATRRAHLERMLDDPRARVGQLGFVYDWFGIVGHVTVGDKDPEVLDGTSSALATLADDSLAATVEHVLFDGDGRLASLLDTDRYWVEEELAELVAVPVAGPELELRELPAHRRGILMHPAVLAAHTKESGASPFTIGKFVYEQLLCEIIGVPAELPPFEETEVEDATLRERLEALTESAQCQVCHARIGPPGFAFLPFDPIGRYAAQDGLGRPYDTAGSIPLGKETLDFSDAAELVSTLAEHESAQRCVAKRLFRWTYGYFESDANEEQLEALEEAALAADLALRDVLVAVVESDGFARVRRGGSE